MKPIQIITLITTAALFTYIAARATLLSITHDEALTFDIINGDLIRATTPNDHLLNTFLATQSIKLFGEKEWALRLPNVLAFLLYSTYTIKLLNRLPNPFFFLCGFLLLHLNPFLIDFFSLARGYGLSIAFMMMAIHYFISIREKQDGISNISLNMSLWASAFAGVLANFTILVFYLALLTAYYTYVLIEYLQKKRKPRTYLNIVFFALANSAFLAFAIHRTMLLKTQGQLFYGGQTDFLNDIAKSNFDCLLYFANYGDLAIWAYRLILFTIIIILTYTLWTLIKTKQTDIKHIALLLLLTSAITILIHYAQGVLYPTERMALFFYPLWALATVFCLQETPLKLISYPILTTLAISLTIHFVKSTNLTYCFDWFYDQHTKEVVELLEKRHTPGQTIQLGAHWKFGPAINYYRKTKKLDWLNHIEIPGFEKQKPYDYYYILDTEKASIPPLPTTLTTLKSYPNTQSSWIQNE